MKLLTTGNPKMIKGQKRGYLSFILHLAPSDLSGYNVCPRASTGCRAACLNTAGRGRFDKTQAARIRKTKLFFEDRPTFMRYLISDIHAGIREAERKGMIPCFRLNGTSDIRWETIPVTTPNSEYTFPNLMAMFPGVQFYDYTKLANRKNIPSNYHLTFSRSEDNFADMALAFFGNGMNVTVVLDTPKKKDLPLTMWETPMIDGDETDLRFLDPRGVFVGLRAKGDAKKDISGFVVKEAWL